MSENNNEKVKKGRSHKCLLCGETIYDSNAYIVSSSKSDKKAYFCSENHCNEYKKQLQDKQEDQKLLDNIYTVIKKIYGGPIPSQSFFCYKNKLTEILTNYSKQKILLYLKDNYQYIYSVVSSKNFTSDVQKITFMMKTLQNILDKDYQRSNIKTKYDNNFYNISHVRSNNKRRSLSDLEEKYGRDDI